MAYHHHYHVSPIQERGNFESSPKPQLPNFEHFLRGAGHPTLTQRTSRQEPILESLDPPGHPSLPTPPLTSANGPCWDGGVHVQTQVWPTEHSSVSSSRPLFTAEVQRRASFALPIQARPQARSTRAYSSNNAERSHHDLSGEQHDQVIYEEDCADCRPDYMYKGGGTAPKEVAPAEVANSVWGVTKAGKPRKRLSQACVACREKKIKCDPGGGPKCSQCVRFNRECKFDTK